MSQRVCNSKTNTLTKNNFAEQHGSFSREGINKIKQIIMVRQSCKYWEYFLFNLMPYSDTQVVHYDLLCRHRNVFKRTCDASFSKMFSFSKCTSIFTISNIPTERVQINRNNFCQRGFYSNLLDLCSFVLSFTHLWSNPFE